MDNIKISIAEDFSTTPGGRFKKEGESSGEEFREEILIPKFEDAKKNNLKLIIDLDGCMGYPSSFLDESFGGLARSYKSKNVDVLKYLEFVSKDQPGLVKDIAKYIKGK